MIFRIVGGFHRRPRFASAIVLAALAILPPSSVRAWGQEGHHIVCWIAWQETSSAGRALVKRILAVGDAENFARLCTWADDIRQAPGYAWTKPHHYVNTKRRRPLQPRTDCSPDGCVLRALGQQARIFMQTPAASGGRAAALKFVAHYMGDLHQPLHVAYAEDAGGNDIAVRFCPRTCWNSVDNLHAVWDGGLLKAGSPSRERALAKQLEDGITAEKRAAWRAGDVVDWARATYAIANDSAYRPVHNGKSAAGYLGDNASPAQLGTEYVELMRPVALEQLQKAGVRLADVLDALARDELPRSLTVVPSLLVTPSKDVSTHIPVRAAARGSGRIVGRLAVGESAELLGRESSWYRVRLPDGREGYVNIKNVRVL